MRNTEAINREIEALKAEKKNISGTTTEVYTRIVGYYRSVRNWNKGKREEFNHRVTFTDFGQKSDTQILDIPEDVAVEAQGNLFAAAPASYLYFYRQNCPNCPPVKNLLSEVSIEGIEVDVDSESGLDKAREWDIMASPTVILLDAEGIEISRSSRVSDLKEKLPAEFFIAKKAILEV